jgi:hypothetical protein
MHCFMNQKGQALLIVVLAMVVALTVGLAVVSRSITNLKNAQEEINSQKALSAAEAGVEQAIKSNVAKVGTSSINGSTTYTVSVATISGQVAFLLNGNNQISQDDAAYIWLTPYSADSSKLFQDTDDLGNNARWTGNLTIYWGNSTDSCANSAIELIVISGSKANPIAQRYVSDPCSTRRADNNFSSPSSTNQSIGNVTLRSSISAAVTNGFLARVIPIYSPAYVGVNAQSAPGSPAFPTQGNIITSVGNSDNNAIKRQLNVFQGYPEMPAEFFPFSIFWP